MAKRNLSKPQPATPQKPAVKNAQKPTPKRKTKGERLCHQELEAHYVSVGLMALEDIVDVSRALVALTNILLQGDETQSAIGDMLRLPVRKLGHSVKEFRDLDAARQKLQQLNAQTRAYYARREKGGEA